MGSIESFHRTLKMRLTKYMASYKTRRFIDELPKIIANYNDTVQERLKMSPNQIEANQTKQEDIRKAARIKTRDLSREIDFPIGTSVRLLKKKKMFGKEKAVWSDTIHKVTGGSTFNTSFQVDGKPKRWKHYELKKVSGEKVEQNPYKRKKAKDFDLEHHLENMPRTGSAPVLMSQADFDGLADDATKHQAYDELDEAFCGQRRAWAGDAAPNPLQLEVELDNIQYTACLVYPTQSYLDSMRAKLGSGSINILFDTFSLAKIPYSNSTYNSFTIQESIQNLKHVMSYCLRADHVNEPGEFSICRFYPFLRSYQLKIGGRLYEKVQCSTRDFHEEVYDYTISKLSTGTFNKLKTNLVKHQTVGREHSIHIYPLETCLQEDLNSGIETTAGMLLTYNCEYSQQPAVQLAGQPWSDAIDPSTAELYVHLHHTQMLTVSNQGVAVSK